MKAQILPMNHNVHKQMMQDIKLLIKQVKIYIKEKLLMFLKNHSLLLMTLQECDPKMFYHAAVSDGHQSLHIPDYEPVMFKIHIGLRKTKYLMNPLENRELFSVIVQQSSTYFTLNHSNCS